MSPRESHNAELSIGGERDDDRWAGGSGRPGIPEPIRGEDPCRLRRVGGHVCLPRPLQRGSPGLRREPLLVSGRAARRRASLPVRRDAFRLRCRRPQPGERASVRVPALARRRVPDSQRLCLRQPELGDRRGDDRPTSGAVRETQRVLLRALGRAVRTLGREGRVRDNGAPDARGARATGDRGRVGRYPGGRPRVELRAPPRVRPPARRDRPRHAVPLRVPRPRLRGVPRLLRALSRGLPGHSGPDDREDGVEHRRARPSA